MELLQPNRPLVWSEIIYRLQEALAKPAEVYLVGGLVRDVYRDHPFHDIDLATTGDGRKVARHLANTLHGAYYTLDDERQIGRVLLTWQGDSYVIDVAKLRGATLLADLQDRDFTINAMAVPLESDLSGIYDPLGGTVDWRERVLRRCSPQSIQNDPIRSLRAVRQSLEFGMMIEPATREDIRQYGSRLVETSAERIRDEFWAILGGKKVRSAILILETLGLLRPILPELGYLTPAAWQYTLTMMDKLSLLLTVISPRRDDNIAANAEFGTFVYLLDRFRGWLQTHLRQTYPDERTEVQLLLIACLYQWVGEDINESVALLENRALACKVTSDEVKRLRQTLLYVDLAVELHHQEVLDPRTIYQYWVKTGSAGINAILLALVRYLVEQNVYFTTRAWSAYLQKTIQLFEGYPVAMNASPLLTGDDLMQIFQLSPSPLIGKLMGALREANALGEIQTVQDAEAWASHWLNTFN